MSINLLKSQKLNLSKGLRKVGIGLGWDINSNTKFSASEFDLDVSVFMLGASGKIDKEKYIIFYGNLNSPDAAVKHCGDNRDGKGEGDDETIEIDLTKVDTSIKELLFVVTIYEHDLRNQNFGQVSNSFIRIYDWLTKKEIAKYLLKEDFAENTAFEFAKLYREDETWIFKALGEGSKFGLKDFVDKYYDS